MSSFKSSVPKSYTENKSGEPPVSLCHLQTEKDERSFFDLKNGMGKS